MKLVIHAFADRLRAMACKRQFLTVCKSFTGTTVEGVIDMEQKTLKRQGHGFRSGCVVVLTDTVGEL